MRRLDHAENACLRFPHVRTFCAEKCGDHKKTVKQLSKIDYWSID